VKPQFVSPAALRRRARALLAVGGAADAALGEHRIEDRGQVEVEVKDIHGVTGFYSRYFCWKQKRFGSRVSATVRTPASPADAPGASWRADAKEENDARRLRGLAR
jgi:hypothetical protein